MDWAKFALSEAKQALVTDGEWVRIRYSHRDVWWLSTYRIFHLREPACELNRVCLQRLRKTRSATSCAWHTPMRRSTKRLQLRVVQYWNTCVSAV